MISEDCNLGEHPPPITGHTGPGSVESHSSGIRQFVTKRLSDLQGLLSGETTLARAEIKKHLEEIRMTRQHGEGKAHYLAEGAWNPLGKEMGPSHNTLAFNTLAFEANGILGKEVAANFRRLAQS